MRGIEFITQSLFWCVHRHRLPHSLDADKSIHVLFDWKVDMPLDN
jgi:hypothetical protein